MNGPAHARTPPPEVQAGIRRYPQNLGARWYSKATHPTAPDAWESMPIPRPITGTRWLKYHTERYWCWLLVPVKG